MKLNPIVVHMSDINKPIISSERSSINLKDKCFNNFLLLKTDELIEKITNKN